jgi:hypothetical protein
MQVGVGVLFLLLTIAWTGVLWWVATRSGQAVPYERVSAVISRIRRWGAPLVVALLAIAFLVSLLFLPYAGSRAAAG